MALTYNNPLIDNVSGSPTLDSLKSGSDKINSALEQILNQALVKDDNLASIASASSAFNNIKQNATTTSSGVVTLGTDPTDVPTNADLGTAASADLGTGSTQVPTNADLGSASLADLGTGSTDVPTNADLGSASLADLGTGSTQVPTNADLGTAAFGTLTTSPTDTTAGRVTRVGDGGLLVGGANAAPEITDFTTDIASGDYYVAGSTVVGGPAGIEGVPYSCHVFKSTGGRQAFYLQQASTFVGQTVFFGSRGGTTGAVTWLEFYTKGNVAASAQNLLDNGSYGLGTIAEGAGPSPGNDLNNAVLTGWYDANNTTDNGPIVGGFGVVQVNARNALRIHQTYYLIGGAQVPRVWERISYSSPIAWGAWTEILNKEAAGTAALADLNANSTDTTEGTVPVVRNVNGIFGFGDTSKSGTQVADLNNETVSRSARFDSATLNKPPEFNFGTVLTQVRSSGEATQLAISTNTAGFSTRYKVSSTWSQWYYGYNQGTILGPISSTVDANGNPITGPFSGAIIERGSNANGEYVKFADGTLICTHIFNLPVGPTTAAGSIFTSSSETWTFPSAFISLPTGLSGGVNSTTVWSNVAANNASSAIVKLFSATSDATGRNVYSIAIGRWYQA